MAHQERPSRRNPWLYQGASRCTWQYHGSINDHGPQELHLKAHNIEVDLWVSNTDARDANRVAALPNGAHHESSVMDEVSQTLTLTSLFVFMCWHCFPSAGMLPQCWHAFPVLTSRHFRLRGSANHAFVWCPS